MPLGYDRRDARTVLNLLRVELRDRHLGSLLGIVWAVLQPLLQVMVYTFVFAFLFRARAPGADTTLSYVVWMISGLGPWIATAEGITAGANSIVSRAALVKNVPMKTELLPVASALTGLVPLTVMIAFVLLVAAIDGNLPSAHVVYLAPAALLQFALVIGLSLFLAPVVVFLRDLAHALPNLLMIAMFLTPIFYAVDAMPGPLQTLSAFNPFYAVAEGYRQPLIHHRLPSLVQTLYLAGFGLAAVALGLGFFRRLKSSFDSAL